MNNSRKISNFQLSEGGQSLLELIVVIAVGIIIITALVLSSISSLRNSQLAKNQAQATRLAQEGMETLRILRDRDGTVNSGLSCSSAPCRFNTDWAIIFACAAPSGCYYKITGSGNALSPAAAPSDYETFLTNVNLRNFQRIVQVLDGQDAGEKKFTTIVKWTDFAGEHQSIQSTILRKL
jgi:type II secretory pathway pseudopilin PulG